MNAQTAIKKFQKAGAVVTEIKITEATVRNLAKFPNGKVVTFDPDWQTGEVTAFAIPYSYDEADQQELCLFRNTVKAAIECATR